MAAIAAEEGEAQGPAPRGSGRIDRIMAGECARLFPTDALRTAFLTPETSENLVLPWLHKPNAPPIAAGTGDGTGSNNWALAGSRTNRNAVGIARAMRPS